MLANFPVVPKGDYIATLRVESGAPALAGREQKLLARYALCGLEELPVVLVSAFAIGAGALGLVAAACVLPGLLKRGFWREPEPDGAAVTPSQ